MVFGFRRNSVRNGSERVFALDRNQCSAWVGIRRVEEHTGPRRRAGTCYNRIRMASPDELVIVSEVESKPADCSASGSGGTGALGARAWLPTAQSSREPAPPPTRGRHSLAPERTGRMSSEGYLLNKSALALWMATERTYAVILG
jgi:hypothetical protein